jgi:sugar phosphate isomerase/epimerase
MIGISTCHWSNSLLSGGKIVDDILNLGFQGVELEYRITKTLYQEMKPKLRREIQVLSIHNIFPKPDEPLIEKGSGDLFLLSSLENDERSRAIEYTTRTIEHANDLGATAVVLHLGRVDMSNPIKRIKELYRKGKIDHSEGIALIEELTQIRNSKRRKNLDAVFTSLEKLNLVAERNGVFLGIENRYYFHEIPNFEEVGIILRKFEGGKVRYWHDVGHASAQENMGICNQMDLLDAYSDYMVGIHLHDIKGLDDHLAPGQGEMDFKKLRPFIKPATIRIIEVHSGVERGAVKEGLKIVERDL